MVNDLDTIHTKKINSGLMVHVNGHPLSVEEEKKLKKCIKKSRKSLNIKK